MKQQRFSKEDIYNSVEMQHRAICVHFSVGTKSAVTYPEGVTVYSITNIKLEDVLLNLKSKSYTSGIIIGNGCDNSHPIEAGDIEVEFDTKEIIARCHFHCYKWYRASDNHNGKERRRILYSRENKQFAFEIYF